VLEESNVEGQVEIKHLDAHDGPIWTTSKWPNIAKL
jgi:hypothetical protein